MNVLIAYATHHGSTREIAERIADVLGRRGLSVTVARADQVRDIRGYDAVLVGSALYCGWLKEATDFCKRNRTALATCPTWLFSSGPLGTETTDPKGRDVREAAVTKDMAALISAVRPRDHRVFFGAYDPTAAPVGFLERSMRLAPGGCNVLPAGDFRDWAEIEAWAAAIADELAIRPGHPAAGGSAPS
jgi:menaquinone-dependent protoporphyrinogen oxidase